MVSLTGLNEMMLLIICAEKMTVSKWHGGKGSAPRPVIDSDAYSKNWERIFNNVKVHDKCGTPDCCGECDTADKPIINSTNK